MKQLNFIKLTLSFLFISTLFMTHTWAGDSAGQEIKNGFSGFLFIGGGVEKTNHSLDSADDHNDKTIGNLNQSSKDYSGFFPIVSGALNYNFASTRTMFSLNNENGLGMDISQDAGNLGLFTMGVHFSSEEVWEDPFLTGRARSKTDRDTTCYNIGWEEISGTDFGLNYALADIDIDNDIAGIRDKRLKRDGKHHLLSLSYRILENQRHEVSANIAYETGYFSGSAYSFNGYNLSATHILKGESWNIESSLSFARQNYDGIHTAFNKKREDNNFTIESAFTYYNPFDFENFFVTLFINYDKKDSNIKFYNTSTIATGMGVGLTF